MNEYEGVQGCSIDPSTRGGKLNISETEEKNERMIRKDDP
jgi:hypothetical protein